MGKNSFANAIQLKANDGSILIFVGYINAKFIGDEKYSIKKQSFAAEVCENRKIKSN